MRRILATLAASAALCACGGGVAQAMPTPGPAETGTRGLPIVWDAYGWHGEPMPAVGERLAYEFDAVTLPDGTEIPSEMFECVSTRTYPTRSAVETGRVMTILIRESDGLTIEDDYADGYRLPADPWVVFAICTV